MTIVPDDKDWTWVLTRPCPECGFDAVSLPRQDIAPLVRSTATQWLAILGMPTAVLRRSARSDRWSTLEYACHVRDVFRIYDERLQLMLTTNEPTYPNWDQDKSAIDDGYNDQDPVAVAAQLASAADLLATHFDTVVGPAWERRGNRSDGARFT
ncbi:MAG TPA: DinB family protein, partial [Acidimicrobiales bacterium]|nr:DinB family protein [Acidimicrobiales bacterium]